MLTTVVRSILVTSLLRLLLKATPGFGRRPACTRSASLIPSPLRLAFKPALFSSATWIASSTLSDLESRVRVVVAIAVGSASLWGSVISPPMRSREILHLPDAAIRRQGGTTCKGKERERHAC